MAIAGLWFTERHVKRAALAWLASRVGTLLFNLEEENFGG
jgi:hypothetical protein